MGPMPPIAPICNGHPQRRADAHVVYIVTIVFTAGDGHQGSADEGAQADQRACEVASARRVAENVKLPS